jgi:hypothetical protein
LACSTWRATCGSGPPAAGRTWYELCQHRWRSPRLSRRQLGVNGASHVRAAGRYGVAPSSRDDYLGFRCAR